MSEEVEKLKNTAKNLELLPPKREKALKALGKIVTKEAVLALLDIAVDPSLLPWERATAIDQARKIVKSL